MSPEGRVSGAEKRKYFHISNTMLAGMDRGPAVAWVSEKEEREEERWGSTLCPDPPHEAHCALGTGPIIWFVSRQIITQQEPAGRDERSPLRWGREAAQLRVPGGENLEAGEVASITLGPPGISILDSCGCCKVKKKTEQIMGEKKRKWGSPI